MCLLARHQQTAGSDHRVHAGRFWIIVARLGVSLCIGVLHVPGCSKPTEVLLKDAEQSKTTGWLESTRSAFGENDLDTAELLVTQQLLRQPSDLVARRMMAEVQYQRGNPDAAFEQASEVLAELGLATASVEARETARQLRDYFDALTLPQSVQVQTHLVALRIGLSENPVDVKMRQTAMGCTQSSWPPSRRMPTCDGFVSPRAGDRICHAQPHRTS